MRLKAPQKNLLENEDAILALDQSGLFEEELLFSDNLRKAVTAIKSFELPEKVKIGREVICYERVKNVVVAGMGGSAIAGEILRDWVRNEVRVPLEVCRGYHLPAYVGMDSLIFIISYSGNTEEALSCMADALQRKCMTVSLSSNGALQRITEDLGLPLIQLPKMAAARAALPYLFTPLPYILTRLKLISLEKLEIEMEHTIDVLDKLAKEFELKVPTAKNLAKKTALSIYGTIPVIYCYEPYGSVGFRFKCQVNENCKIPSRFDMFPKLNHNEIIGWEAPSKVTRRYSLILIREAKEPMEIGARIELLKEKILSKKAKSVIEIYPRGETRLAKIFSLIFTMDMISMYLAVLHNRDPMASEVYRILKYEVSERLETLVKIEEQIRKRAFSS